MKRAVLAATTLAVCVLGGGHATAWDLAWIDLLGGTGTDNGVGVASDATGVYLVGAVTGALPGQTSAGNRDAYLRKYSFAGEVLWTRQFGTSAFDLAGGLAIHGDGIYVAGRTLGALPGQTSAGNSDAYVRRYTPDGDVVWTTQFGTDGYEGSIGVAANDHGVFVGGETFGTFPGQQPGNGAEPFLARLTLDEGALGWVRALGIRSPNDPGITDPVGVAADDSGVYMVANVPGPCPSASSTSAAAPCGRATSTTMAFASCTVSPCPPTAAAFP